MSKNVELTRSVGTSSQVQSDIGKPAVSRQTLGVSPAYLSVMEIFNTVQGEGGQAGVAMTFLRLAFCNLGCDFCDTKWDIPEFRYTYDELARKLRDMGTRHLMITGGEPMVQMSQHGSLIPFLRAQTLVEKVSLETNGMIYHLSMNHFDYITVSPKAVYNHPDNPIPVEKRIHPNVVQRIKVNECRHIICGRHDDPVNLPEGFNPQVHYVSPVFYSDEELPQDWKVGQGHSVRGFFSEDALLRCMEIVNERRGQEDWRLSLQTHKIMGIR